jgi:hypothetical protein
MKLVHEYKKNEPMGKIISNFEVDTHIVPVFRDKNGPSIVFLGDFCEPTEVWKPVTINH